MTADHSDDTRLITREEMVEMFGSEMPIEAVKLLVEAGDHKTIGEVRAQLRRIAHSRRRTMADEYLDGIAKRWPAAETPTFTVPEEVTPEGLRARAELVREHDPHGREQSTARHLDLAADTIASLRAQIGERDAEIARLRADRKRLDKRIHKQRMMLRETWQTVDMRASYRTATGCHRMVVAARSGREAAIAAARAAEREACAKVADEWQCSSCGAWFLPPDRCCERPSWGWRRTADEIAAAIRSRTDEP